MNDELVIRTDSEALSEIEKTFSFIQISDKQKQDSEEKIQGALNKANEVKDLKHGFWSGRDVTISALQELSAQQAEIISDLWDAHKRTFENLSEISNGMRRLFLIGVANSAFTRSIIDHLRTKSEVGNLTEDARNALLGVIKDLEAQADAQNKIQRLKERVNALQDTCATHEDIEQLSADFGSVKEDLDKRLISVENSCKQLNSLVSQNQRWHYICVGACLLSIIAIVISFI